MLPLTIVKNCCDEQVAGLRPVTRYEYTVDRLTHPSWVGTTLVKYRNGKLVNAY